MENGRILQGRVEGRRGIPRGRSAADGRRSMTGNGWGETVYRGIQASPPPPANKIFKKFEEIFNRRESRGCAWLAAGRELHRADASKRSGGERKLPGGARDSRAVCGDSPQTPDARTRGAGREIREGMIISVPAGRALRDLRERAPARPSVRSLRCRCR